MASHAVTISASKERKNGQISAVDVTRNGESGGSGVGGEFSTPPHMMVNGFVTMDEYNRLMKKNSSLQGMLVKMEMNVASVAKKG